MVPSLLDCGTASREGRPWRPHYCYCYTRCRLCCIGKRPSGATPQPAQAPTAPVRQPAAPSVSRRPTHHCGQQPSPPRPGGAYVAQCHRCEARTRTLVRPLRPPPEHHPRLPVHSSSDASGERPATATPGTAAWDVRQQRPQHTHRLTGVGAPARQGDARQCPPTLPRLPPPHLANQTIKDGPLPGLIAGAHRRRRPRAHPVSSGTRQRSQRGAYCTAQVGVQGRQERVNEACGGVPSACTVHADSTEKGAARGGCGDNWAREVRAPVRCGGLRAVSTSAVRTVPAGYAAGDCTSALTHPHARARTLHATLSPRPRHPRNCRCPHLWRRLPPTRPRQGMQPRRSDTAGGQGTTGGRRRPRGGGRPKRRRACSVVQRAV